MQMSVTGLTGHSDSRFDRRLCPEECEFMLGEARVGKRKFAPRAGGALWADTSP